MSSHVFASHDTLAHRAMSTGSETKNSDSMTPNKIDASHGLSLVVHDDKEAAIIAFIIEAEFSVKAVMFDMIVKPVVVLTNVVSQRLSALSIVYPKYWR